MKNDDLQSANRRKSLPCKELSVIDQSLFWIWFFENHPAGFYGAPAPDAGGSVHTFTFKALGGVRKLRRGGEGQEACLFRRFGQAPQIAEGVGRPFLTQSRLPGRKCP